MESYREALSRPFQQEQGDTLRTDRILHAYYLDHATFASKISVHREYAQQKDVNESSLSGKLLMLEIWFHFQGSRPRCFWWTLVVLCWDIHGECLIGEADSNVMEKWGNIHMSNIKKHEHRTYVHLTISMKLLHWGGVHSLSISHPARDWYEHDH